MHCPAGHLLPGPKFITELLPPCPPHPEPFANTCHPLSITKSPVVPRWHSCPQSATTATATAAAAAAAASLLPCQPLVQKCLLLCPEPCETTRLLPGPRSSGTFQTLPTTEAAPRLREKKRLARSLPPCAPRCPEPGRLRFPPCGLRCSSASCRGQCRSQRAAKCPAPPSCPELTGGYSLPLRGVTECPPQPFLLREYPGRCSKGYPGQEFLSCYSWEQRLSSAKGSLECPQLRGVTKGSLECPQLRGVTKGTKEVPPLRAVTKECPQLRGVTKECPQLRAVTKGTKECSQLRAVTKECPQLRGVTKGTKECSQLRAVTKECSQLRAVTKGTKEVPPLRAVAKGSALSRSRCPRDPRGPPRPSRLSSAGPKRSGHSKKSRCASKWLW